MIGELRAAGVSMESDSHNGQEIGPLTGKTFVFTGELTRMPRPQAQELVTSLGGKASASVSKKTSYVVEGAEAGSKADKARSLGVPLLSEEDFFSMIDRIKSSQSVSGGISDA